MFTELENGSVQINTTFQPGDFNSWHVHLFPVDFTADPATRCSSDFLGGHVDPSGRLQAAGENYSTVCTPSTPLYCEAGDLTGKFGNLTVGNFSFVDNDPELKLRGRYSIIGRSVVIHPPGHGHLACANIHLDEDDTPGLYVADFLGPTVGGSIYFRQSGLEPEVGVFIYAKLFYTSNRETTMNHAWGIYDGTPSVSVWLYLCTCLHTLAIKSYNHIICLNNNINDKKIFRFFNLFIILMVILTSCM